MSFVKPMIVLLSFTQNALFHSNQSTQAVCPNHLHTSLYSTTSMFYSSTPASLSVTGTCFAECNSLSAFYQIISNSPLIIRWEKAGGGVLCNVTNTPVISLELQQCSVYLCNQWFFFLHEMIIIFYYRSVQQTW